jgi:glycosyltransferase involved in cell wall biosynthesis
MRGLRRSAWRSPPHVWRVRLRRALGRTSLGWALKRQLRARRRTQALAIRVRRESRPTARSAPRPSEPTDEWNELVSTSGRRNVVFASHCDFTGNSALHVYSIASELHRRGFSPAIAVPGNAKGVRDLGCPPFPVLSYRDVRKGKLGFADKRGADLVHAFTPREPVRKFTLELVSLYGCPYVVHLEDNEEAIADGHTHPLLAPAFVAGAAGMSVVVDRLLELKPGHVPGVVVWPGFDERVLSPCRQREEVRERLGLGHDHLMIVYTGNIHETNLGEMRSLYLAVSLLRRGGHPAVLVKTGWDFVPRSALPDLGEGIRELGWVARVHVPELLAAADILVQPGSSNSYNDYRFPSKLPDFLASGRPVVLPRTNIGLHLRDGAEALILERGDAAEISEKVALLAANPELRVEVGEGGRAFALRELRWSRNVDQIIDLYQRLNKSEELMLPGVGFAPGHEMRRPPDSSSSAAVRATHRLIGGEGDAGPGPSATCRAGMRATDAGAARASLGRPCPGASVDSYARRKRPCA